MIERIKELISYLGISNRAFSTQCGIKDNTFTNQLNGKRELSLSTISSILSIREDVSAEWLLRGEGTMLKNQVASDANSLRLERLIDTITTLQETINEKTKTIQLLEEENRRMKSELTANKKIG